MGSAEFYPVKRPRHKFILTGKLYLREDRTMHRILLICALVSASTLGCTAAQPRPDAQTTAAKADLPCAVQTGSRLSPKSGDCSVSPGRSYSQTDVERTGKVDLGEALQMLDPSITVHH